GSYLAIRSSSDLVVDQDGKREGKNLPQRVMSVTSSTIRAHLNRSHPDLDAASEELDKVVKRLTRRYNSKRRIKLQELARQEAEHSAEREWAMRFFSQRTSTAQASDQDINDEFV
ncbi:hypothetical protein KIPB_008362, partial [Kipferlia bialata]